MPINLPTEKTRTLKPSNNTNRSPRILVTIMRILPAAKSQLAGNKMKTFCFRNPPSV